MKLASGLSWSATGCASTAPRGANLPGSAPRTAPTAIFPAGAACARRRLRMCELPASLPESLPWRAPAAPSLRLRPAPLRSPRPAELQVRTAAAGAAPRAACRREELPGGAVVLP